MPNPKKKDKVSSKKDKASSKIKQSSTSLSVDIKTQDITAIIQLLASNDKQVAYTALKKIYSYCLSNDQLIQTFCDNGIDNYLKKLIECQENEPLALVLELIYNILNINYPIVLIDESKDFFKKLRIIFDKNENEDILLITTKIMNKITQLYPELLSYIFDKALFQRALLVIKNKLNDELKINSIFLIKNLITSEEVAVQFIESPALQINLLLCFIKADTSNVLQKPTLDLFIKLCEINENKVKIFLYERKFPQALIQFLLDKKYKEIYYQLINLIAYVLNDYSTCNKLIETEEFPIILSLVNNLDSDCLLEYTKLLSNFSKFYENDDYRQKLYVYGFESIVVIIFKKSVEEKVLILTCEMMNDLSGHHFGLELMINIEIVTKLIHLMLSKNITLVSIVVKTIYNFLKQSPKMIDLFYAGGGLNETSKFFLAQEDEKSLDFYDVVLSIAELYLTHKKYREEIITREIFEKLLDIYQSSDTERAIKSAYILSYHVINHEWRKILVEKNAYELFVEKIKITDNEKLLANTLTLIKILLSYKKPSKVFLMKGLIPILKPLEDKYPCANLIVDTLLTLFLPLKFFRNKRLEITDAIKDNFYLINGTWNEEFPLLEDFELKKKSTFVTIYIVDYSYTKRKLESAQTESIRFVEDDKKISKVAEVNFGGITEDPYLYDYFVELKRVLFDVDETKDKIKIIAKYVADQLSGFSQVEGREPLHIFKIHLNYLKQRLGCNFIPIGFLRMGYSCERALLFKVLVDYFNHYTTLVKKGDVYWNEVAIVEDDDFDKRVMFYAVVDLFEHPGDLYLLESREALNYLEFLNKKCF